MLRFRDINSLVKYLDEELNKLLIARKVLDEEVKRDVLVDVIEVEADGQINMRRDRMSKIAEGLIEELDRRIEQINSILEEIRSKFGDANFTGMVLLELNNGLPSRVLLSQPLTLGEVA